MSWLALIFGLIMAVPLSVSERAAGRRSAPYRFALGLFLLILAAAGGSRAEAAQVPEGAAMYRRLVEAAVSDHWPAGGSAAQLAAQLHQESVWRPKARSRAGAIGMAQFMPATARWIATVFPDELGPFDPWDPAQAIRGAALYDRWLYERVSGRTECDRWAFALSAYNGGLGWVGRDKARASATGADPLVWFGHAELSADPRRSAGNVAENRGYVRRILTVLTPLYVAAGWPGQAVCS